MTAFAARGLKALKKVALFAGFLFLFISPAIAQTLGQWDFTNTTAGTAGTNNTVSTANFSAAIPTLSFNGSSEYYGQDGWPAGGINTASYMQFTLTPNTGHALNILSIVFQMRRSNTGSPSGSGPTGWSIRSSLDGFTSNISSGHSRIIMLSIPFRPAAHLSAFLPLLLSGSMDIIQLYPLAEPAGWFLII